MDRDRRLREHLVELLRGGSAHLSFDDAVKGLAKKLRGAKPPGQPHTPWRLIEHMRIAQRDILEFSKSADYESPPWPEGYWPDSDAPPSDRAWNEAVKAFRKDLHEMIEFVEDPSIDLLEPIPHGQGKTIAREAMLLADHNAYHIGQLVIVRRMLGEWTD